MYEFMRLSQVYEASKKLSFDDSSKIILMSDCHRGDGSWADNFSRNRNIYMGALSYYYDENYTYIELGDGDELWKNRKLYEIMREHSDVFLLMSKFIKAGRFHALFGNHDIVKKNNGFVKNREYRHFYEYEKEYLPLFEKVKFQEGIVLKHTDTGVEIFLVHGHQADFINDRLWRVSRFLVRYIWRSLELIGINDPTSATKNYRKRVAVEQILIEWTKRNNQMLIAGHTHRPVYPKLKEPLYFNDGSCVHPRGITGIEIADGYILLVKWSFKTKKDGTLFVGRDVLEKPQRLRDYFVAAKANSRST